MSLALESVSDSAYRAQEDLLFRTAARLKGLLFYRGFSMLVLLAAAWLYYGKAAQPLLFWLILLLLAGFNALNIYFGFIGSDCTNRPALVVLVDAAGYMLLAALTGGFSSHFVYLYFLLVLYSSTWFNRRLSWWVGGVSAACVLLLYGVTGPALEDGGVRLTVVLLALLGLTLGAAGIGSLVSETRERMVRAAMDLILANKRVNDQQAELLDSEERIRLVLDTAAEGIVGMDAEGNCTFANRSAIQMLGYREESDLIGENLHALAHHAYPDGRPYPETECPVLRPLNQGEASHSLDEVFWRADGSIFPVEFWSHPVYRDKRVVGIVSTFIDITERRAAARALRDSEQMLRNVLVHFPGTVFWKDRQSVYLGCNNAFSTAAGLAQPAEIIGKTDYDLPWADTEASAYRADDSAVMESATARLNILETQKQADQRVAYFNTSKVPLFDAEGKVIGVLGTSHDITQRIKAEDGIRQLNAELEQRVTRRTSELADSNEQLRSTLDTLQRAQNELIRSEKLASLGSLVAGVAHELNTPLGNSLTVATTLADKTRSFSHEVQSGALRRSALNDFVEMAGQATQLLTRNLYQASELIMHFKQVAVDQTSAQRRFFDLKEVVSEIVTTLQPQFRKTHHRIEMDIPSGVRMDSFPGPLGQVLTNLVSNALVHGFEQTPEGVVRIESKPMGEHVQITITDNGSGIPAENLPRIFDPFFTTRLGRGGSGLGLHIVYSIVTRILGGRVFATSNAGDGTTFALDLPLSAPEKAENQILSSISIAQQEVSS